MSLLIRHTILKISFKKKKVSNHNIFPAILVSVLCRTSHAHDFVVEKCASCVHQNATLFFFYQSVHDVHISSKIKRAETCMTVHQTIEQT